MIWFLEKDTDLAICEIRQTPDHAAYEFEVATPAGPPQVRRFESPKDLITSYLVETSKLRAAGWHPRAPHIEE